VADEGQAVGILGLAGGEPCGGFDHAGQEPTECSAGTRELS